MENFGAHVNSIRSGLQNIWGVTTLQDGVIVYVIGDAQCEGWLFRPYRNAYERVIRAVLSFFGNHSQKSLTDFLSHPFRGDRWYLRMKSNSHGNHQITLIFWSVHNNGVPVTEMSIYKLCWEDPYSQGLVGHYSSSTSSRLSALDFNDHIVAVGKENSPYIYFMAMDIDTPKASVIPTFVNSGRVESIYADVDKIVVGCSDSNAVHVWDFSGRKIERVKM